MAQKQVAMAERYIARQRDLVRKLEWDSPFLEQAKDLLAQFEALHTVLIVDRDRLKQELSELDRIERGCRPPPNTTSPNLEKRCAEVLCRP